jgi:hypothetical protein
MNWFPRRVQIHLSTAIVMMFVAGGLIWVNTRITHTEEITAWEAPYGAVASVRSNDQGWPLSFRQPHEGAYSNWFYNSLVIDALVAISVFFAVWLPCEWLIRRRAARKDA